jgi:hypothetical protein
VDPGLTQLLVSFSVLLANSSIAVAAFCTALARVVAARVVSFWKMLPKHAFALRNQKILRFWGLTAQRGWARFILDRFQDLVLCPLPRRSHGRHA